MRAWRDVAGTRGAGSDLSKTREIRVSRQGRSKASARIQRHGSPKVAHRCGSPKVVHQCGSPKVVHRKQVTEKRRPEGIHRTDQADGYRTKPDATTLVGAHRSRHRSPGGRRHQRQRCQRRWVRDSVISGDRRRTSEPGRLSKDGAVGGTGGVSVGAWGWIRPSGQRCAPAGAETNASEGSQDTGFLKTPLAASAL
ncbi:MAG: hypothetical protein RLZZ11_1952 [Cyanobacteriota bacterium]